MEASPTPHGVGGLKCPLYIINYVRRCPTPHGVGGLKYLDVAIIVVAVGPTPHGVGGLKLRPIGRHPSTGRSSHPSRGGWIEILLRWLLPSMEIVPPLTGWVD